MLNARWKKSSYSGTEGSCVELRLDESGAIKIRDSKNPDGPQLTFDPASVAALVAELRDGNLHG